MALRIALRPAGPVRLPRSLSSTHRWSGRPEGFRRPPMSHLDELMEREGGGPQREALGGARAVVGRKVTM